MENFRVLGPVPFDHLIGLMQHAVAFINPSKFEGWSTTVEEAKSMGKQIILSDIPVHQEQAPARGIFFPATNPDALAQAMLTAIKGFDEKADLDMQEQARQRFPSRQIEFGETYVRIVRDLV
jgi:glycosyltransferase involved in cell wall biosynthesis